MKFFTPKFIKTRCYLRIFSTFGTDFKLATCTSILSLRILSDPKLVYGNALYFLTPKIPSVFLTNFCNF
jgi:hypothetical protein